jgi:hypothetical protein
MASSQRILINRGSKMNHCQNYMCTLLSGCVCTCSNCMTVKQSICQTCGTCPTCGRSANPQYQYLPQYLSYYYNSWYCWKCMMYHPAGFICYVPNPYWYTFQTNTINTLNNNNVNILSNNFGNLINGNLT